VSTINRSELQRLHERRLRRRVQPDSRELRGLLAPYFKTLPPPSLDRILDKVAGHSHVFPVESGEFVLREGEYSDSAFVMLEGTAELRIEGAEPGRGPEARLEERVSLVPVPLRTGELFGELSALSQYPASGTVRVKSAGRILQVRLPGLRLLMAASTELRQFVESRYRERTLARYVRRVELFSSLNDSEIDTLKQRAELRSFGPGELIAREGDAVETFCMVRGGYLKLSTRAGTSDLAISYLREGDYFGAAVLEPDSVWPFNLETLDHVELVMLTPDVLRGIVQDHPAILAELMREHGDRLALKESVSRNPVASEHLQMAMETGLIHGESVLLIDLSTCTRCDACVRACAGAHGGAPRMIREGQKYREWLVPVACYQCTDPICMLDCPTGSITRQVGSLVVTIDESTCIACGNCVERCPWDNIVMLEPGEHGGNGRPAAIATKCDLSQEPTGTPPCVQACPQGSAQRISFKDMPRVSATLGTGDARRLSRIRQVLKPTEPRLLAITVAAALTLTVGQIAYSQFWPWSAKRDLGLALGIIAALAFVGEMLYSARRRVVALGRVRIWLQAHVHVGILGLVAAVLHAGFRWPSGSMGWALLSLSLWTTATGVLGRVLQKWAATSLGTGLRIEAVYERIPEFAEKLRAEADSLMMGASRVLASFYEVEVRDSLSRVTPSWSYLFDVRAGQQAALAPLRRMVQFVEPEEKPRVHDLIAIVTEKMELDAHYSLQRLLRRWPWLHVPAACLLMSLLIVHILAWLWY